MITLIDYGAGNLHSLHGALQRLGFQSVRAVTPAEAPESGTLILPGVGHFTAARNALVERGWWDILPGLAAARPLLGICLGLQLLFERSEEGEGLGLGLIPGRVRRLRTRRQPHMGWNTVAGDDPLLAASGLSTGYYAHSFVGEPGDPGAVTAWTTHEDDRFPAMVRSGGTLGVQFHPEKSSAPGVALLRALLAPAARPAR